MSTHVPDQAPRSETGQYDTVYRSIHDSAEFKDLRRRYQRFVFPATVAFLSWYLLYVVMSGWAPDFMGKVLWGNVNVALVFGLLQFASTFLIAFLYARYSNRNVDPPARELERRFISETSGGSPTTSQGVTR